MSISNFKFNPATLTVPVGATVTWTNQDEEPHTVAAKDGSFHSPGMDTHGTYCFTFTDAGLFDYICSIHPFMTRHRGGDQMSAERDPQGMTRRQLIRHSAWFGAAVGADRRRRRSDLTCRGVGRRRATGKARRPCGSPRSATATSGSTAPPTRTSPARSTDAIGQINGLGYTPDFVIHTGDLTHLATPDQFDQVKQMLTELNTPHVFTVPGEHDSTTTRDRSIGKRSARAPAATAGTASTSQVCTSSALVNTLNLKKLGHLGTDQLEFVEKDVAALSSDTPIIVFSHIPLFAMYPDWGWGTDDATQALSYLQAVLVGDMPQRPCPPTVFQDRGQCDVLQRHHHRLSAARAGSGPRTQTGDAARRKAARRAGHPRSQLHQGPAVPRTEGSEAHMKIMDLAIRTAHQRHRRGQRRHPRLPLHPRLP